MLFPTFTIRVTNPKTVVDVEKIRGQHSEARDTGSMDESYGKETRLPPFP